MFLHKIKLTSIFFIVLCLFVVSCTSEQPTTDIEAIIETRVQSTLAASGADSNEEIAVKSSSEPTAPAQTFTPSPIPATQTSTPIPATQTPTPSPAPPTETFTPSPIPSTATPTPDPRFFWDDFETGIKPEWGIIDGEAYAVKGKLDTRTFKTGIIGENLRNYKIKIIRLTKQRNVGFQILTRVQDGNNYMLFECTWRSAGRMTKKAVYVWGKVSNGEHQDIPGTIQDGCLGGDIEIEVEDNIYRTFINGEEVMYFADDSYSEGGFIMRVVNKKGGVVIDDIEVYELP